MRMWKLGIQVIFAEAHPKAKEQNAKKDYKPPHLGLASLLLGISFLVHFHLPLTLPIKFPRPNLSLGKAGMPNLPKGIPKACGMGRGRFFPAPTCQRPLEKRLPRVGAISRKPRGQNPQTKAFQQSRGPVIDVTKTRDIEKTYNPSL